jgi:hypothetical protein
VVVSYILQVQEVTAPAEEEENEQVSHDIFEVFATEKKKREDKSSKVPKLTMPLQDPKNQASSSGAAKPSPQFRYQSNAKNQQLVTELQDFLIVTPQRVYR